MKNFKSTSLLTRTGAVAAIAMLAAFAVVPASHAAPASYFNFNSEPSFQTFRVATPGMQNLILKYASSGRMTGFGIRAISDVHVSTSPLNRAASAEFARESFLLSPISTSDSSASRLSFRFSGSTVAASTSSLDDIPVLPIPEPATVLGGLLAIAGLCFHQRRRLLGMLKLA